MIVADWWTTVFCAKRTGCLVGRAGKSGTDDA
jgi:hypothetical protein